MATIRWRHGNTADPLDIQAIEREMGVVLPKSYIDCALQHNGGRPQPCVFDAGSRKEAVFEALIRVDRGAPNGVLNLRKTLEDRLPPGLLPIVRDPFGNLICLSFRGRSRYEVVFWDHEAEGVRGLTHVCDTFDQLLDMLHEPD